MTASYLDLEGRLIGPEYPALIVGEVAQAHDGSLGTAHSFIDAIAKAGADAVKFQAHLAEAESTPEEPWRVRFGYQDASRFEYWKRMEFTPGQWDGLREHASEAGLLFLCSPFSVEAVDMLLRVGVPAWKVASGEVSNVLLLERLLETRLPILLSTGMSGLEEIDRTVNTIRSSGLAVAVMQCTSMYPTPPERVGIDLIPYFRGRYGDPVGLSDHSGTIFPALAAATLGVDIIEVHVTLSREMFGPDVEASVTTEELGQLVGGVRFIERMKESNTEKNEVSDELADLRTIFGKSLVARTDLERGTVLSRDQLSAKKPGTGIGVDRLPGVLGRRVRRKIIANEILHEEDLEPN